MTNSIQSVKDKLKKVAKEKNVDFNFIMRFYMYDRFIERLSVSEYKDNFILKGGFYLSTLFGIDNRNTMDIDTAIRNAIFTDENIIRMIEKIVLINIDDNVIFSIDKTSSIREEDEYGGLRITLGFALEGFKDRFHIDVATGDPIHPGPNDYEYRSLIDFRKAVEKTFKKRQFNEDLFKCLEIVKSSNKLQMYWSSYTRKNSYARNISYEDIIECLEKFIELLVPVSV